MSLLILEGLKKHYGAQEVLRGASLRIDPGQKVGIVGRNGSGKTTLLRIIEGLETPDYGKATLRKGTRLGHVAQRPHFEPGTSVLAYVETGLEEVNRTMKELERTAERMGEAQAEELEELMRRHDSLSREIEALGGWETDRRVETVLSGIGLPQELWEREARTLSGGEKSRTALARELCAGHELLLLDEPTNHLDLAGIEWIEDYVRELVGAVVIVSHDRRLLDNAVDSIVELERGELRRYPGNYSKYIALKEERYESEYRAWKQQRDYIKREDSFIKKHMGSQRTAEAKGRQKKLSNLERLREPFHDVRRPVIRMPVAARSGECVLEANAISHAYGEEPCFSNVDLRVGRGQRIGIVGANGAGKTTLLKVVAGRLAPQSGRLEQGHNTFCGYYDQETGGLRQDGTAFTEIRRMKPDATDLEVRSQLARFLFRGDDVDKEVSTLSGGERARLCLAKLVLEEPNWLALDEPTNHLDLASRTAVEEMLGEFQGAILCVSHDRALLDGLCNHIVEVVDGGVREYSGNYSEYRRTLLENQGEKRRAEAQEKAKARSEAQATAAKKSGTKGTGKIRNPYRFEKLEKRIIELEAKLAGQQEELSKEEVYRDPERLKETQIMISELQRDLAEANTEWEEWA